MSIDSVNLKISLLELEVLIVGVGELMESAVSKDYTEELEMSTEEYADFLSKLNPLYKKLSNIYKEKNAE